MPMTAFQIDYFALAAEQARRAFLVPVPKPVGPSAICCASYSYVIDHEGTGSQWVCPVCSRSWVVQGAAE